MCDPPPQTRRVAQTRSQTRNRNCLSSLYLQSVCESGESESPSLGKKFGGLSECMKIYEGAPNKKVNGAGTDSLESQTRKFPPLPRQERPYPRAVGHSAHTPDWGVRFSQDNASGPQHSLAQLFTGFDPLSPSGKSRGPSSNTLANRWALLAPRRVLSPTWHQIPLRRSSRPCGPGLGVPVWHRSLRTRHEELKDEH